MATQRKQYSSDLTDKEWDVLEPYVPKAKSNNIVGGAPERHTKREIINGILYVKTNGCKWKDLPHDFPPSRTVYHYFNTWSKDGTWEHLNALLREKVRKGTGKKSEPSAAIIDSQSVKNVDNDCISGYDAGKKIKGIKRHIAVDTLGLILVIVVHAADIQDRDGAKFVLKKLKIMYSTIKKIFVDQGYAGRLVSWTNRICGWTLEVVKRIHKKKFSILPKRWIVERTFSWFGKARRLSKNYEVTPRNAEAMVYITMIHIMTKRLARGY